MAIKIENLSKSYDGRQVFENLNMELTEGQITCIMAPSGKGKTTLLRILIGLEQADRGKVAGIEGKDISVVFQEDRLCGNLNVLSNIRLVQKEKNRNSGRARSSGTSGLLPSAGKRIVGRNEKTSGDFKRHCMQNGISCSWTNPLRAWIKK